MDDFKDLVKKAEDFNAGCCGNGIDKSIYEVVYELNNRPDWVIIPMQGILHIMKDSI